jgi:eukaryotic-like serine/threonine-protein kinase
MHSASPALLGAPGNGPFPDAIGRRAAEAESARSGSLCPGAIVAGKYRLERLIGSGGMGAVWAAQNLPLDVAVALKFLVPAGDRQTTACRLHNEAQLLARIKHPSLVAVHDVGVSALGADYADYIVMELLEGRDLDALLLERGALPPIETVRLMLPIIDGLLAAHGQGIIHRDIKPGNIFLADVSGRTIPKLVDFGAALAAGNKLDVRLTHAGTVIGSPLYMSPEQARGALDIDERVDVWGVSAALYECLSGRPPFEAQTYEALLHTIVTGHPLPLGLSGEAAKLEAIVLKGLAKDPAHRWQSAASLGRALASWLLEQGVQDDIISQSIRSVWLSEATMRPATRQTRAKRRRGSSRRMAKRVWPALMGALLLALGSLSLVAGAGFSGTRHIPSAEDKEPQRPSISANRVASHVVPSGSRTPNSTEDPRARRQAAPISPQPRNTPEEAPSPEVRPIEQRSVATEHRLGTRGAAKIKRQPSSFDPFWGF